MIVFAGYAATGWIDAARDAPQLAARADRLIANGRGGDGLGHDRLNQLIMVQDPGYWEHGGVDFTTPGAGNTTITQSLAKRLAFSDFQPGFRKIRQTTYAISLSRRLSKEQVLALFLDNVPMGTGPDGWVRGFFDMSMHAFGRLPRELNTDEFAQLVAVMIAPSRFSLITPGADLRHRTTRITRLWKGECLPLGHGDVWLEGCR